MGYVNLRMGSLECGAKLFVGDAGLYCTCALMTGRVRFLCVTLRTQFHGEFGCTVKSLFVVKPRIPDEPSDPSVYSISSVIVPSSETV